MGRRKYFPALLITPLLLTGCFSMPDPINPELSTTVVGRDPFQTTTTSEANTIIYGDEAYIVDNNGSTVNIYTGTQPEEETPEEHFATMPTVTIPPEDEEPEEVYEDPVEGISFEIADTYTDTQLLNHYGSKNNIGYFDHYGNFYCKETGQFGESTILSYADAVSQYTAAYGKPDLEFTKNSIKFAYWFEDNYVYCVSQENYYVSLSISEYYSATSFYYVVPDGVTLSDVVDTEGGSSHFATLLYNEYGRPYHEDFYNYIFRSQDYYYVIARNEYACTIQRR